MFPVQAVGLCHGRGTQIMRLGAYIQHLAHWPFFSGERESFTPEGKQISRERGEG